MQRKFSVRQFTITKDHQKLHFFFLKKKYSGEGHYIRLKEQAYKGCPGTVRAGSRAGASPSIPVPLFPVSEQSWGEDSNQQAYRPGDHWAWPEGRDSSCFNSYFSLLWILLSGTSSLPLFWQHQACFSCAGSCSVLPHLGEWLQHQHCQGHPQTFHLSRASWHLFWSKFGSQRLAKDLFPNTYHEDRHKIRFFCECQKSYWQQKCSSNIAHCLMVVSKVKTKWKWEQINF